MTGPDPKAPAVAIVEDELPMRRFLRASLEAHGYRVLEAATLAEASIVVTSHSPSVVILDLGLPDGDGIVFLTRLREWTRVPVIVVSARGREDDKVRALDAGADDYLTKPFGVQELLARVRVALRHADRALVEAPVFTLGDLVIDFGRRVVTLAGHEVHLTPIEYRLLTFLAKHAGRVVTHQQILREVWGPSYATHAHYVRVHMAELRKKIEADPARPTLILTETGIGYRLREP
ncbi:MAG: response regulator [Deltaproteobacteria bacterium]|nr:response regulator [Deltaproteobacteria bacterium]